MATFAELKTRVGANIIDLPTAVSDIRGDLINSAIRKIQGGRHTFRVQESLLSTTTDRDNSPIDLLDDGVPSDFKEWLGRPYRIPSIGGKAVPMAFTTRKRANEMYGADSDLYIGAPQYVFEGEPTDANVRSLYVRPFPDGNSDYSDGEYRVYFPYARYIADLSSDGDTNWFTTDADRAVECEATWQAFMRDHDEERGAIWKQMANDEYNEVVKEDKRYRLSGTPTWEPSVNAV